MKHINSKKVVAIVLSLMMLLALVTSCSEKTAETSIRETIPVIETTERTVAETTILETTVETSGETTETTFNIITADEVNGLWRDYINAIDEDGFLYGFMDGNLLVSDGESLQIFTMGTDGEIVPYSFDENLKEEYISHCRLSRSTVLRCPVYLDFGTGEELVFDDSIADGTYYGRLLGVSADGTVALVLIGDAVVITDDLLNDQNKRSDTLDYYGTPIDISDDFIIIDNIQYPPDISYELLHSDGSHFYVNERLAIISIDDACDVDDNATSRYSELYVNPEDYGQTSFTQSNFWGYIFSEYNPYPETVDLWYRCESVQSDPIVISDSQITEIDLRIK